MNFRSIFFTYFHFDSQVTGLNTHIAPSIHFENAVKLNCKKNIVKLSGGDKTNYTVQNFYSTNRNFRSHILSQ